jgi:hypothetical protein
MNVVASPNSAVAPSRRIVEVETVAPVSQARQSARRVLLPREPFSLAVSAPLAVLVGLSLSYAATITVPTASAYELKSVEREIAREKSRQERLVSRKASLEVLPRLLDRGKALGIATPVPVSLVLEPRS